MSSCWRKAALSPKARRHKSPRIRWLLRRISVMARRQSWGHRMDASPLLVVEKLNAGYGETEVLRGVDLTVNRGEIVAVLGSNGVGKSTLNRAISGIVRTRAGSIRFDGVDVLGHKPAEIVRGLIHVPE